MKGNFRRFINVSIILLLAFAAILDPVSADPDPLICNSVTQISQAECLALVAVYNSAGGANWSNNTNWLETNTPSNWYGVMVSNGKVVNLTLTYNNLVGVIPTEIGALTNLEVLFLNGNLLSGSIPTQIGLLGELHSLSLSVNQLSGSLPTELGNLTKLKNLSVIGNRLSGTIPSQLGQLTALETLFLNENQLSGSIPSALGSLTNLQFLSLAKNQLSGPIPAQLGALSNLQSMFFDENQLSGSIPTQLGSLGSLTQLSLAGNQLSGQIPPALGSLQNLVYLNLRTNQLSGAIPTQLGSLANLQQLILSQNALSGPIPGALGTLSSLHTLTLYSNQLSGSIPTEIGNLTNLQNLYLHVNNLSGPIPPQIGSLVNLRLMFLNNNRLSGDVPDALTNLTAIADQGAGGARLRLDYNELNVPSPYPSVPPTALEQYLILKNPAWVLTQSVTAEITPGGGGLLVSRDLQIIVNVPAGAVTETIVLKLTMLSEPTYDIGELAFGNHAFILTAFTTGGVALPALQFLQPAVVTVGYTDSDMNSIADEGGILLYSWDTIWEDAGQTCSPPSTPDRDLVGNEFAVGICSLAEFALLGEALSTVSGQVTDGFSGMDGVTITASNGTSVTTDEDGYYTFTTLHPGTYTLTPSKSGYSFAPVSRQVVLGSDDLTDIDFTGTMLRFSIAGQVTFEGSPLEDVTVSIGNLVSVLTDASGNYTFAGMPPGNYTVRPVKLGFNFTPATRSVTITDSNQTGKNFVAEVAYYAISGRIMNGAAGIAGVLVSAGPGQTATTDASGNYSIAGLPVGTYTITPSKDGFTFTPASQVVTLTTANRSNINFTGTDRHIIYLPITRK